MRTRRQFLIGAGGWLGGAIGAARAAEAGRAPRPGEIEDRVPELMARHRVPGVAVVGIEGRRVAWERYFGAASAATRVPVTAATLFEAASMSKPTGAHGALKLTEQGRLELDRPLRDYLDRPYLPDEPKHLAITARMALAHTTGFPNWRAGGWQAGGPLAPKSAPGAAFTYSGEGYTYLQHTLEHITGENIGSWLERTVLRPAGLRAASYTWRDDWGDAAAAGHTAQGAVAEKRELFRRANIAYSLYCPPRGYAAYLADVMATDRSAGHALSAESFAAMLTPAVRTAGNNPLVRRDGSTPRSSHYGLGWALDELARDRRVRHSGSNGTGFRSYCEFYPARGTGLVIMTNAPGGAALWRALIEAIGET